MTVEREEHTTDIVDTYIHMPIHQGKHARE